jgi:flagellin
MIDAAEGAQSEITTILIRMRELSIQAGNDTNNVQDRANLQLEIDQLTAEIDRISEVTTWAGVDLLNGRGGVDGNGTLRFQVGSGTNSEDMITTQINSVSSAALGIASVDPSTAIEVTTGGSMSAAGVLTMNTNLTANVRFGGNDYTLDYTVANGTAGSFSATDPGSYTVTASTGGTYTLIVNGVTISETGTGTTAADIAADLVTAFNASTEASIQHLTATQVGGTAEIRFTATAADKAVAMEKLLEADPGFNNDLVITSNTSGAITFAAKSSVVSASTASAVIYGTGTAGTVSVSNNELTVSAAASGAATSTNYTTRDFTINGSVIQFNSYEDGTAKGFNITTQEGLAAAIKSKLESAGLGVTVTQSGSTTTTKLTLSKTGSGISLTSASASQASVNLVDAAIAQVNEQRAKLGAISNRLEMTVSNLTNIVTNLQTGRGRIEDADFAAESTELAKTQILQQASMAMLSQANASKQSVMNLLQGR